MYTCEKPLIYLLERENIKLIYINKILYDLVFNWHNYYNHFDSSGANYQKRTHGFKNFNTFKLFYILLYISTDLGSCDFPICCINFRI